MADVKPCDLPCEKCGSADVLRRFRESDSTFRVEEYGRARNRYASAMSYIATVHRDHIDHTCRCCQYGWQTLPMRKPRKPARPTPEGAE